MARVRGMGVAVITSTCGGRTFFSHSAARCFTPKRCCSSMTTKPRLRKRTVGSMRACVPTRICTVPSAMPCMISLRALPFTLPVRSSTVTGKGESSSLMVAKCCSASISVGAMMHAWKPLSRARRQQSKATMVLPQPTSPCNRRFICRPLPTSRRISRITRFCASVSSKGRQVL